MFPKCSITHLAAVLFSCFSMGVWGQNEFDSERNPTTTLPIFMLTDAPQLDKIWSQWLPKQEAIYNWSAFTKVSAQDFWLAVDMEEAIMEKNQKQSRLTQGQNKWRKNAQWSAKPNNSSGLRLTVTGASIPDPLGTYGATNSRPMRMFDPCPPFGVCSRCAPYKLGSLRH
ncbi:MAG: hypothetical protein P8I32_00625 [Flavobacteriaceae bacterium]|nr:hypothetical protein [Flavobacteriaceae bacterium]